MMLRHQAAARLIGQYDANNTYQYIINREETPAHLGGDRDPRARRHASPDAVEPSRAANGKAAAAARRRCSTKTCADAQAFVDRWRPRVEAMANARHRGMLRVILGETLEQKRFFEQALAGRTDLLGRRSRTAGPARSARCCPRGGSSNACRASPSRSASTSATARGHLVYAAPAWPSTLTNLTVSSHHRDRRRSDVTGDQPDFLNAAVVGETTLAPRALLDTLLAIERDADASGRFPAPPARWISI